MSPMRDPRASLPVKAAALFLAVLLALASAVSAAAVCFAEEAGFYRQESAAFEETPMFWDMCQTVAYTLAANFAEHGDPYQYKSYFQYVDPASVGVAILNEDTGETLFSSVPDSYLSTAVCSLRTGTWLYNDAYFSDPSADGAGPSEKPPFPQRVQVTLYFITYANSDITGFSTYRLLYDLIYPVKGLLPWIAVFSTLSFFADIVFLCCAAGHRRGTEEIVPNFLDRVPLDLYLLIAAAILLTGISCVDGLPKSLGLLALSLLLIFIPLLLTALATMMTLSTRLKLGHIWRNTICWRLYGWCLRSARALWRGTKEVFHILPLTYRTILMTLALLCVQHLLSYWSVWEGLPFLLLILLDIAVLLAATLLSFQMQQLKAMGQRLADGDLEAKIDTGRMFHDIRTHGENLNAIGSGMTRAVEQRMKSERLKTELITNVSHDIKTPLTSIVNYVDLLKKEDLPAKAAEYLIVLDRQSNRLKKLTEDLLEASKASTGNIAVSLQPIVVNEIIHQAVGDYDQRLAAGKIEVIVNTFEGNLSAMADGRLLWRVLDNLLSNVCKYAMPGSRLYIDLTTAGSRAALSMKNISRDPLNVSADELMERFVRGDSSRHAEGSGLGLNIAKSLMELMGGAFSISVDGDLFKAEMSLPLAGLSGEEPQQGFPTH